MKFEDLPIGASFRWLVPKALNGLSLDGHYIKGSASSFGSDTSWQPWEAGRNSRDEVIAVEEGAE